MADEVVIIGAGLAGLSAAVELTSRGVEVIALEASSRPGGKLDGYRDADGDPVEHGMHGFWTQYRNLFDVVRRAGIPDSVFSEPVRTSYLHEDGRVSSLKSGPVSLPSPLFLLREMSGMSGLGPVDMLSAAAVFAPAFGFDHARDYARFDDVSLLAYLRRRGATKALHRVAIEPLARSLGFTDAGHLSAAAFLSALSFYVVAREHDIDMRVATGNPAETIIDPMVDYINSHGGEVRFGQRVTRLETDGDDDRIHAAVVGSTIAPSELRVPTALLSSGLPTREEAPDGSAVIVRLVGGVPTALSARCTHMGGPVDYRSAEADLYCPWHGGVYDVDGLVVAGPPPTALPSLPARLDGDDVVITLGGASESEVEGAAFILATEVAGAREIVAASDELRERPQYRQVLDLETTSSVVVRMWLDRDMPEELVAAVLTRPEVVDVFFVVSRMQDELRSVPGSVVEAHCYVVDDRMHLTDDEWVDLVTDELGARIPAVRVATVEKAHVSRHLGDFTLFSPGSDDYRPGVRGPMTNLFLAGDWLRTSEPHWYMERAVATGREAAAAILEGMGLGAPEIIPAKSAPVFIRLARGVSGAGQKLDGFVRSLLGVERP
ncbi:MAG: FAD-dependent oxidoreductase [Deltaproteobacteria bacterium]|nr:FAD-dependent oxidoreductase [Deltaproteobacteria bacterium]